MSVQDLEQLTLYQGDSPANPFPWLESKKVKGTTVTSGRKCSELSESLRRVGLSARTYLESCALPGEQFVRTWSVKDTLSPYLILKLRLSERRTDGSGCSLSGNGLWATPNAADCKGTTGGGQGRSLRTDVKIWPTPTANDCKPACLREIKESKMRKHGTVVHRLRGMATEESEIGGALNPTWVEWLMGFPTGWSALNA